MPRYIWTALLMTAIMAQGQIVRTPDMNAPLPERWSWAKKQQPAQGEFFIGYEIEVLLEEGFLLVSGFGWLSGAIRFEGLSMDTLLSEPPNSKATAHRRKVTKRLAILIPMQANAAGGPSLSLMDLPAGVGRAPVAWLGAATTVESYALLAQHYKKTDSTRARERFIEAIGFHDSEDATTFLASVRSSNARRDLRREAIAALALQSSTRAAEMLIESALEDEDMEIRLEAISTLENLNSERSLSTLLALTREKHPRQVRTEAVQTLGRRPERKALEVLRDLLTKDRDQEVASEAIEALSSHPSEFDRIAAAARKHRSAEVRETAFQALTEMDPDRALPIIRTLIDKERDPEIAAAAVEALEEVPEEDALPVLIALARGHRYKEVRIQAIESLTEYPAETVLPQLKHLIYNDPDPEIQAEATAGLGEIESKDSLKLLLAIAKNHPAEEVREEALDYLKDHAIN